MKLETENRAIGVHYTHNTAVGRPGGNAQGGRERGRVGDKGVIPHRLERAGESIEKAVAVVFDEARLPVYGHACTDHVSTFGAYDGLMPEADSEDGEREVV